MKKNMLVLFLLNITLILATTKDLKFEILEKNNTEIRIIVKSDNEYSKPIKLANTKPVSTISNVNTYTVKAGDTLSNIAKKFNISVDYLAKINNIQNRNIISVNQKLNIK
ncbi:LysM peptidoglycan-binding domain-containing protein [Cetobacterium somerae]|uniref:LysM peptidoglycan-binding domain-containing protein n=1 Tax=Cetobacterium somerae TaxID=188913 RepID=UPI003891346F